MKKFLMAVILLIATPFCFAGDLISPTTQLQQIANRMITQLESNKSQLHSMNVIRRIVNQTLLPNVDMDRMSSSVVGRDWRAATPAQRAQFEKEFSYLVTTTYASALSSYNGDKVNFQPIRGDYASSQTLRVNSLIVRPNGQRISITYDVLRNGNAWKVYDFSIEHVSMVQSYRSQFSGVLANGGMSALLARLQNHNKR